MNNTKPVDLNWKLILAFWVLMCAVFSVRTLYFSQTIPLIADTDDAMRLTTVRDFLAGQNWFDHTQYRLNTPWSAQIHWSRLIDLPIAGSVLLFSPVFGDNAIFAAAWAWPLLLLLALLTLSVALTTRLVGRDGILPGLVLPILSAIVLVEFAPGRVDHHSVQIVLSLLVVYATVSASQSLQVLQTLQSRQTPKSLQSWRSSRWAVMAGLAAATSLAIGIEALPIIMVAVLVFGLAWIFDQSKAQNLRWFGVAFSLGTVAHLALALPPALWLTPACDALSSTYAVSALVVGLGFVALSYLRLSAWVLRLVAGGVLGVITLVGLVMAFPLCVGGPYAEIDPWLAERWLGNVIEAKPVWQSFSALPAYTVGITLPPLLALIAIAIRLWQPDDLVGSKEDRTQKFAANRAQWAILGLFLLAGFLVMALQVRGARLVAPLAVPAAAWVIVSVRQRYLSSKRITDALGLMLSWLCFSGVVLAALSAWLLPTGNDEIFSNTSSGPSKLACLQAEAFNDLAGLPPERIMAPVDLGTHILFYTEHAVVAAPYHRNQDGVRDTFAFFNQPLDEARSILQDRGISLIVTCPYLGEMRGFEDTPDTAFIKRAEADDLPDWIQEFTLPNSVLKIYAVLN